MIGHDLLLMLWKFFLELKCKIVPNNIKMPKVKCWYPLAIFDSIDLFLEQKCNYLLQNCSSHTTDYECNSEKEVISPVTSNCTDNCQEFYQGDVKIKGIWGDNTTMHSLNTTLTLWHFTLCPHYSNRTHWHPKSAWDCLRVVRGCLGAEKGAWGAHTVSSGLARVFEMYSLQIFSCRCW